jgi:hypothetical protein
MNSRLNSAIVVACAALASVVYAQEPNSAQQPPEPPAGQSQQAGPSSVSITGCLMKGSEAGSYSITDQKTGEKYPFNGPAQLDKYVNQTVTLSGAMTTQGSDKLFRPERIAPVSATCQKAQ